jgi:hypothetical protein
MSSVSRYAPTSRTLGFLALPLIGAKPAESGFAAERGLPIADRRRVRPAADAHLPCQEAAMASITIDIDLPDVVSVTACQRHGPSFEVSWPWPDRVRLEPNGHARVVRHLDVWSQPSFWIYEAAFHRCHHHLIPPSSARTPATPSPSRCTWYGCSSAAPRRRSRAARVWWTPFTRPKKRFRELPSSPRDFRCHRPVTTRYRSMTPKITLPREPSRESDTPATGEENPVVEVEVRRQARLQLRNHGIPLQIQL